MIRHHLIISCIDWPNAEANTAWCLYEKEVGPHVPCFLCDVEILCLRTHKPERTNFVEHGEQAGTAWSTTNPENERVIVFIVLRLEIDIVDCLLQGCVEVSGVPVVSVVRHLEADKVVFCCLTKDSYEQW